MAIVGGQDRIAENQGSRTDQQVRERDNHATALLFGVEPASQQRSFLGVRVHRQVSQEFIEEGLTPKSHFRRRCAMEAMNELSQAYGRQGCVLVAGSAEDSRDQLFDSFPATFGRDDDAGVED